MKCVIHSTDVNETYDKLIKFSEKSWLTFIACAHRWKLIEATKPNQISLAKENIQKWNIELVYNTDNLVSKLPSKDIAGYHERCYKRFTNNTIIMRHEIKVKEINPGLGIG